MIQNNNIFNSNTKLRSTFPNGMKLTTGRVTDVILSPDSVPDAIIQKMGAEIGIGAIFYDPIDYPQKRESSYHGDIAFPLFPNYNHYPLPNELVSIIFLPGFLSSNLGNTESLNSGNSLIGYYFSPINFWRNFHHNIFPPTIRI